MIHRRKRLSRSSTRRSLRRRLSLQVLDERRVLASISGVVFDDANTSLHRDTNSAGLPVELGLPDRIVFVDADDDGTLDPGERFELTDASGAFEFDDLSAGTHVLRVFNGTTTQTQTVPSIGELNEPIAALSGITTAVPSVILDPGTLTEREAPAAVAAGNRVQLLWEGSN
ncbi:MAG: hypothetical protein AAF745_10810, partial [Planctomycetota bacterium]